MARKRKLVRRLVAGAVVLVGLGVGLNYLRHQTEGLKNAFSPEYWEKRAIGEDEYVPRTAYFRRGPRDRKEVTLTLDDGPHGQCTTDELAILKAEKVPATFFVVGKKMREYPGLIKQMVAEGQEVGNHTETHPRLDTVTLEAAQKEIEDCGKDFEKITGRRMTLFRPPGMHENDPILAVAKNLGYHTVGWNVAAADFTPSKKDKGVTAEMLESLKATPDQISDRITAHVIPGAIILLHDQPITAQALPKIIKTLREEGYTFVSCREALSHIDHPVALEADPLLPTKVAAKRDNLAVSPVHR